MFYYLECDIVYVFFLGLVRVVVLNICGWVIIFVFKECFEFSCVKICYVVCGLLGVIFLSIWCVVWSLKLVILMVYKMVGLKCDLDKML